MSISSNKAVVTSAMDAVLGEGDLSAVDRYFATDYIQHSATGAEGPQAVKALLAEMPAEFRYEPIRVLGDGEIVACHGVYYGADPEPIAAFDVFRIADGQLAEHWDNHQPLTGPAMTGGPADVRYPDRTEATRAAVEGFVDQALIGGARDEAGAGTMVEHGDGFDGLSYLRRHFTVAEGEFALIAAEATRGDEPVVCYDLFRVGDDGRVAEHWAVVMPVPAVINHGNGLF